MSETEALRALMEADRWIDRVAAQRSHRPEMAELATLETELRALVASLALAQASLAPVQTAYENARRESERVRVRRGEIENALSISTANARELATLQHELEHLGELLAVAEDRELDLLVELEPHEHEVVALRSRAQPQTVRRTELRGIIAALQATLDEELESLRADRTRRTAALSGEVRARYDRALVRSGTSGAAQVDAGRCDGCRIALSPLDLDHWKAQPAGTFMACPVCGRLLLP